MNYNPNDVGQKNGKIFGLPFEYINSKLVLLPVPWDATTSYKDGTSNGPASILEASPQLDLYDPEAVNLWKSGIYMKPPDKKIVLKNKQARVLAKKYIKALESGKKVNTELKNANKKVNEACLDLKKWVLQETTHLLKDNKLVGLVGGDHSTPLGLIEALSNKHQSFGILQIDAHADLRNAYEDFTLSHASIMFNALKIQQVSKLVQVGIRDYCDDEIEVIKKSKGRIVTFFDHELKKDLFNGINWNKQCEKIIKNLPDKVYISFDIDGLDPKLCPNTGTPVPGGFQFEEIGYLLNKLVESGKKIIGFDLNEVNPARDNDWNENVGARVLYKLCCMILKSNSGHL